MRDSALAPSFYEQSDRLLCYSQIFFASFSDLVVARSYGLFALFALDVLLESSNKGLQSNSDSIACLPLIHRRKCDGVLQRCVHFVASKTSMLRWHLIDDFLNYQLSGVFSQPLRHVMIQ